MTRAEAMAFNLGVLAVLDIAAQSAAAIAATGHRPITDAFAIAALDELAQTGRALLIAGDDEQPILPAAPDDGGTP